MKTKNIIIGLVALVVVVVLAIIIVPKLTEPEEGFVPTYWPTNGWQTATPEEQGLDSVKIAEAIQTIQKQNIPVNSILIVRNGKLLLDAYFHNPYDGTYPHDMASVTKSVMTTLIGIAAGQGKIDLDKPILSYFPDRMVKNLDERKQQITVRHLVGNVNGLDSGCLAGDQPTIQIMISNSDWIQASLDRKMVQAPGEAFCYDSPGIHLLSAILQQATGMTAHEFARQYLFEPLGINDTIWESDPQGYTRGAGDLHLYPQDAAKIGYLFQSGGVWDGKQIVPADWVEEATKAQVDAGEDSYGYGWWVYETSYGATGRGGQRIYVVPSLNAIVVTTGGGFEYDQIESYLTAAVVDPANPLPPNPQGVALLEATLDSLVKEIPALPAGDPPAKIEEISGKTYIFEPNPALLKSASIDFSDPAEATITLDLLGANTVWKIGMDGQFRRSPEGAVQRGYWRDAQTFVIQAFDVGMQERVFTFKEDAVTVEASGLTMQGKAENP